MFGLKKDWVLEPRPEFFDLGDYEGATARWCRGCGDHGVLAAVQRLCRDEQLPPEKVVCVSGIGCSSRFPHYMKTYGFHGLHGRALPIACGIRARRPDLHIFVVTGDGDNCSIGAGHWLHAVRYNMKLTVLLLDNNVYGLTKNQTSPTSAKGQRTNTHPRGAPLEPLNPISVTLGVRNASFVAQTFDWHPGHLYATLQAAHRHPGLAFVRVLQRCPHYTASAFEGVQKDPALVRLLVHPEGIPVDDAMKRLFPRQVTHDPTDLAAARTLADDDAPFTAGLYYRNPSVTRYDLLTSRGLGQPRAARLEAIQKQIDRYRV